MIQSFKSKALRLFFEKNDSSKISPNHVEKVRRILVRLHASKQIKDMDAPGLGLHPLKGDLDGNWSVTVNKNWRIVFKFSFGEVYDVDYIDYH